MPVGLISLFELLATCENGGAKNIASQEQGNKLERGKRDATKLVTTQSTQHQRRVRYREHKSSSTQEPPAYSYPTSPFHEQAVNNIKRSIL